MIKFKLFIFVVLSILQNICNAQNKSLPVVLISEKTEGGSIYLNYKNIFADFINIKFQYSSEKSVIDTISILKNEPFILEFNANTQQFPVYAAPGDTIFISTKAHGRYYQFSAKGCAYYRVNFFNYLDSLGLGMGYPDFFNRSFKASNYEAGVSFAISTYTKRMAILREYSNKYCLDKNFLLFMEATIKEHYVQGLLTPYLMPLQESRYDLLPATYSKVLNQSPLHELLRQPKWISFSRHRGMIVSYVKMLSKTSLYTPNELLAMYRNAVDSLSGESKDYMLFFLMKNNVAKNGKDIVNLHKSFQYDCSSQKFKHYIDSLFIRNNGIVSEPAVIGTQLEDTSGNKVTWKNILDKNKGSVLYVDFWASWCGPCRKQIPFSKKAEVELKGKKVKFIYISIDGNKNQWLNAMQAEVLNNASSQHYLLKDKSDLAIYLGVPPIPHYLIINREGSPVFLDATRPDNPATIKTLRRLSQ